MNSTFQEFIDRTQGIDFENYGNFELTRIDGGDTEVRLHVTVSIDDDGSFPEKWTITCGGVYQHKLRVGQILSVDVFINHPLLVPTVEPVQRLGFHGRVADPPSIVGKLYEKHIEVVGDWIPFQEYFMDRNITELIAAGFGVLAEGPVSIIGTYSNVLTECGIECLISGEHAKQIWDGSRFTNIPALKAFVLDECFVLAQTFSI
jgi:hypothetical protein